MKVIEHTHPLKLIDLQLEYLQSEEEEEEEEEDNDDEESGDAITKEGFHGVTCNRCGEAIHMYHRYYYTCTIGSSCDFSLHKFCGELPKMLEHPSHPDHTLILSEGEDDWHNAVDGYWYCSICQSKHKFGEILYMCSLCPSYIEVNCAVGRKIIHHPCHPHVLICATLKPILCDCSGCGKRHEGFFYLCTTCCNFSIHNDCAFLPKTLLIQQTTDNAFYHTHPLTISYSFPWIEQVAKHGPRCRVCDHSLGNRWIYKCDKCIYYCHVDCATSRTEPFMSIILPPAKNIKDFEDADHPHLLHLPFPDETFSMPKHLFFQETIKSDKVNLKHISHEHPLVLVQRQTNDDTGQTSSTISSSILMCHDPMKKIQLLCNGCLRPITSTMPFYKCAQSCNFSLHEWCTQLPTKIENHTAHPQHALVLMYSNDLPFFFGVFTCNVCRLPCNGFTYGCVECECYVDVCCGFIPKEITHESHPNHLLSLVPKQGHGNCRFCLGHFYGGGPILFRCNTCEIYIHTECALLLPKTIRHKYDKHPMHLSYLPIENHKSEYFCEICEEDLNPHASFYHCQHCVQSVHSACAPLVLKSETHTYVYNKRSIYRFVNVKFGGVYNIVGHPHPLSLDQCTERECDMRRWLNRNDMVLKCLECEFVIHYDFCEPLKKI